MDYHTLSATQAYNLLIKNKVTSHELQEALLNRISQKDRELRAFLFTNSENPPDSPHSLLAGLPISVKDQFHIEGTPCSFGLSKTIKSNTTAPVIETLLKNGATLIGKTSLPPMAMDFQTSNKLAGICNNPWNVSYTSGGSSGGGATAVASGMSFVDIGADLAGSLRIPACFCGVYSLLPSEGAISNKGIFLNPEISISHFARPGPIAREPEDLLLIWEALKGPAKNSGGEHDDKWSLNLAIWKEIHELSLDKEISSKIDSITEIWQDGGISLQRDKPGLVDFKECWQLYGQIMGYEISGLMNPLIRWLTILSGRTQKKLSPYFFSNVLDGYRRKKDDYQAALTRKQQIMQSAEAFFEKYDAWILPVTCCRVFEHMEPSTESGLNRSYNEPLLVNNIKINYLDALTAYTTPISLIGHPVITMPIGLDSNGLPVGIQVIGKMDDEHRLIGVVKRLSMHIKMPVCPSLQD